MKRLTGLIVTLTTLALSSTFTAAAGGAAPPSKLKYGPSPRPLAVPLSQDSAYFRNNAHPAPDFWALIPFYVPQFHGAACSVASVTMVLNAAIGQRARTKPLGADDSVVDQKVLLEKVKAERWKERILGATLGNTSIPDPTLSRGMTLDQLGVAAEAAFHEYGFLKAKAQTLRFEKTQTEARIQLETLLRKNEETARDFLIANFDQKSFTDDAEVGHISPIGAYDAEKARVLILDSDREYYEPYWVSVDTLLAGLQTRDRTSGKVRGLVHIRLEP